MWYATEESSPFAVPNAFYYVTHGRRRLGSNSRKTAELVSRLMRKVTPEQWTRLYRDFRGIRITTGQVPKLAAYPKDVAVELLGVASLNANGHVRQAALEWLSALNHPRAVPYVLLRLADWVPAVRRVAQDAMMRLLNSDHAAAILQHGHLVDWLERVQRVDLSEIRTAILTTLRGERFRETLLAQQKAGEHGTRFFCYRLLADETDDIATIPALITAALSDRSSVIRRWMARRLLNASENIAAQWLPQLLADTYVLVRLEVLRWLPESLWPAARDAAGEMIYSDSPGLRSAARFLLKSHGITDFAECYRERLEQIERLGNTATVPVGPTAGLCETGDKADLGRIAQYTDHPRPRIREAALTGLGQLNAEAAADWAIQALSDTNARVRRAAVRILQKAGSHCRQQVRSALEQGSLTARLAALDVLVYLGGWDALRDILLYLTFAEDIKNAKGMESPRNTEDVKTASFVNGETATLQKRAWEYLEHWAHYSIRLYAKPPQPLAAELGNLMARIPQPANAGRERLRLWKQVCDTVEWVQQDA